MEKEKEKEKVNSKLVFINHPPQGNGIVHHSPQGFVHHTQHLPQGFINQAQNLPQGFVVNQTQHLPQRFVNQAHPPQLQKGFINQAPQGFRPLQPPASEQTSHQQFQV